MKTPKRLPRISTGRIILAVTALVVVYFLVAGGVNFLRSQQLGHQASELRADVQDLQERYQRLQALRDYLDSDEFIEAVARQELGLVREGEMGFVVISTQPSPTPAPGEPEHELWWDALIR